MLKIIFYWITKIRNNSLHAFGIFGLSLLALLLPYAAFAQVTVSFGESVPAPNNISKQYCADPLSNRGVEFHSRPSIVTAEDSSGNVLDTSSPPQFLIQSASQEFSSREVLIASFTTGQSRVGLMLGLDRDWGFPVRATLTAFDDPEPGEGNPLAAISRSFPAQSSGPIEVTTPIEVQTNTGTADIWRIELKFSGPTPNLHAIEIVDDLTFSSIGPLCAIDLEPPVVVIDQPTNGQVLTSPEMLLSYSVSDDVGTALVEIAALDASGNEISKYEAKASNTPSFQKAFFTHAMDGAAGLRVTATDFIGNTGFDTVMFDLRLPGPDLNLWVQAMEITQAIQSDVPVASGSRSQFATEAASDSVVPLIAGKRTIVRLYPGMEGTSESVQGVRVSLHCLSSLGVSISSSTLCPGPLAVSPENPGVTIDPAQDNSVDVLRTDADRTFNFVLPPEWTVPNEPRWLVGVINAPALLHECGFLTDDDCDDGANFFVIDLGVQAFKKTSPILIQPIFFCVRRSESDDPSTCTMVEASASNAMDLLDKIFLTTDWDLDGVDDRFFTNVLPIADLNSGIVINPPIMGEQADGDFSSSNGFVSFDKMSDILSQVCSRSEVDALSGLFDETKGRPFYVAFVDPPTGPSGMNRLGTPCVVVKFDALTDLNTGINRRVNDNDYCRNCPNDPMWNIQYDIPTVNHELGHAFSEQHASCDHLEDDGGGCAAAPEVFPCPHGGICESENATRKTFIFEPYLMRALPPEMGSAHAHDFMSYGPDPKWVSPHTYTTIFHRLESSQFLSANLDRGLLGRNIKNSTGRRGNQGVLSSLIQDGTRGLIANHAGRLGNVGVASQQSVKMLYVAGRFSGGDDTAVLNPIIPIVTKAASTLPEDSDSSYSLILLDENGAILERRAIILGVTSGPARFFSAIFPDRQDGVRIELTKDAMLLAERQRSPNQPTAKIISPAANAILADGETLIKWEANDADGDPLFTTVQYSNNLGRSWRTLTSVSNADSITVDAEMLAGGARLDSLIRILVSDGFNGSAAISERFTVLGKEPRVRILGPSDSLNEDESAYIEFAASISDMEDGTLPPSALVWSSDRDGLLGNGYSIRKRLSPGGHFVTLTATDSDGNSSTDLIRLIVRNVPTKQPVAMAGPNFDIPQNQAVKLDGTASYDLNQDDLIFEWSVIEAPMLVSLDLANPARPSFFADQTGEYIFELRVNDGEVGSYPDRVKVTVH
ncbi:hypothetical protein [Sedimentitalea sp.]|uniref:PKD domain-containing protein n=1 Tax=Sedimentitalea sp. TaxID=2048915 RepID=UPI0032978D90